MSKKVTKLVIFFLLIYGIAFAQNIGDSKFLWVHNFQFFQYDYKIGATLQAGGENCNVWVENEQINAIIVDQVNSYVYAGTKSSGVLRKKIDEQKWTVINAGFPNSSRTVGLMSKVHDFIITSNQVLFAGVDDGLYRWDEATTRWRKVTIGSPVFCLEENNNVLYAGIGGYLWSDDPDEDSDIDINMGAFISTDGGNTWERSSNGLPYDNDDEYLPVYDITKANGSVFASTDAGVFKTNNNGIYWEGVEKTITASLANIQAPLQNSTLDLDKLAELGESIGSEFEKWVTVDGISNEDSIIVKEYDEANQIKRVWKGPHNTILKSDDEAQYFVRNMPGIVGDEGRWVAHLSYYTADPSFEYMDNYNQLDINNLKYRGQPAMATIIDPQKAMLLVVSYPSDPNFEVGGKFITVKYVNNAGDTLVWCDKSVTLRGLNKDKKGLVITNANMIYGTPIADYDLLNNTTDLAKMTLSTSSGIYFKKFAYSKNLQQVFAGNANGVFKTIDKGVNWSLVGSATGGLENVDINSLFIDEAGKIYAGTLDGIYTSSDAGATWTSLGVIEPATQVLTIALNNGAIYAGTPFGFFTSVDNGTTWNGQNYGMSAFVDETRISAAIENFENSTPANSAKGVYQIITESFGVESLPDFDKTSKINIVIHNIIEKGELENTTSNGNNGTSKLSGYFRAEDQSNIGNTNKGEYLYIDSRESTDQERAKALAHQLVRMIVWNKDYDEERWIVEGLSFYGEKLCGFPLPTAMPNFQTLTGANTVFSLIAGTPLSPWSVKADNGDMNNRYTQVSMFTTFLTENFGGFDLMGKVITDPANGWRGVQNALKEQNVKFEDVFAAWTIANTINDTTQIDPITGAKYGYCDSTYSAVLNNYMAQNGLGMNFGPMFGHDESMSDYNMYSKNAEFKDGLNNWAYMIRYFFPFPSLVESDPVQAVVRYWGKDMLTGQPINIKFNAKNNTNLRVQLIKVTPTGKKDVEDLTPTFNSEKELTFNVLSKYEPTQDTTALKYHKMYMIISNQDSLGGAAPFVITKDVTPPEIKHQIVHNPLFPEFLELFVYSNEKTFADVSAQDEIPTVDILYFTDSTRVDMAVFDTGLDSRDKAVNYLYKGRYHITMDGEIKLLIRNLQDLPGNDVDYILTPINVQKAVPQSVYTVISPDKNAALFLPENSLRSATCLTAYANHWTREGALDKVNPTGNIIYKSSIHQFGPVGIDLLRDATITINYSGNTDADDSDVALYVLENNNWKHVPAVQDKKNNTFTASVNRLGFFAVIQGNIGVMSEPGQASLPQTFALHQNYPNPFNPTTEIKYQLPREERITLKVFNMNGQLVNTLIDESKPAGYYTARWNGLNQAGFKVSSGLYLYELKAGNFTETRKMILVK